MYTNAIKHDPTDHVFYSNRSGCYVALGKYAESLTDAETCIKMNPLWYKGYVRKAQVFEAQKKWRPMLGAYNEGLECCPGNKMLEKGVEFASEKIEDEPAPPLPPKPKPKPQKKVVEMTKQQKYAKSLMDDPEIAEYFKDESFKKKISACYNDPNLAMREAEADPRVKRIFEVLMKKQQQLVQKGEEAGPETMPMPKPRKDSGERPKFPKLYPPVHKKEKEDLITKQLKAKKKKEEDEKKAEEERIKNLVPPDV